MTRLCNWLGCVVAAAVLVLTGASVAVAEEHAGPNKVVINSDLVLEINGRKTFVIGFTLPPPPDSKAPNGRPAYEEIREGGGNFFRTGPMGAESKWDDAWIASEQQYQDAAARYGMYCAPWLKELSGVKQGDAEKEKRLREVIEKFKDHPALGVWKGEDEPEWGKRPIPPMVNAAKIIHETDPNHPIWIVQAPRGTVETMKAYDATYDITGVDIYPISYPPGKHVPAHPNKEISMVGDYAQTMMQVSGGKKPVWLTLQVAFSGTTRAGTVLRMPTFPELRYMTYQSIVTGARGLIYFGPHLPAAQSDRDKKLGWNWTFWQKVLRPVLEEIGDKSPLNAALVAPNSKLKLNVQGIPAGVGKELEYIVRETPDAIFLIATKRQGETLQATFSGLPKNVTSADVLFEEPRKVEIKDGQLADWFAPFDVHVYRILKDRRE
jgi:hypothetical protein